MARDLAPVHHRLRTLLAAATEDLVVTTDDERSFVVQTGRCRADGYPYQFGGVRLGARYVSYHLTVVYYWPDLLDGVDEALLARMQGKSCFNFTTVDEALLSHLDTLTRRGVERLRRCGDELPGQGERTAKGAGRREAAD